MGYTSPSTQGASSVIPTSRLNSYKEGLDFLATSFPHCNIKESTAQSVATATWVALVSDEEVSDTGGMHESVTNPARITVPAGAGGLYRMHAVVQFTANATGNRFIGFGKNGAAPVFPVASCVGSASLDHTLNGSQAMPLVAGDYIECKAYHTVGVNLNVQLLDFYVEWRATA